MTSLSQKSGAIPESPARDAAEAEPQASSYILWLLFIYAVAIGLRLWRFFSAGLSGDNSTTGNMGLAVLQGEFPFFFFGQNWMGGLDAILAAPLYAMFGPSALTLNILSPVISLAIMLCLQPLLRKTLGVWGMLAGLAYLAVPPTTWLFWNGEAQVHYMLGLLLCALVLLVSHRLWQAPRWTWGGLVLWGLFAGCAIWTNFAGAVVILPCVVFLLVTGWRKLRWWSVPLATLGGLLGGFPLIWFNLTHGMVHANQAGVFASRYVLPNLQALAGNALPLILGLNTPEVGGPTGGYWLFALLYGLLLVVLGAGVYFLCRQSRRAPGFACLLLAILVLNLVIVISSAYGKTLFSPDQRYLLSLYLILPFLAGASAKWLAHKNSWAAVLFMLALALIHASQYADFQRWGSKLLDINRGFYLNSEAELKRSAKQMSQAGFKYIYSNHNSHPMNFLTNSDPVVVDYWRDRWLSNALKVDAQSDPGLLNMPQGSLDLLGLPHATWRGKISHAFAQPQAAQALLPRRGWSAQVEGQDLGRALSDADLTTGFSTKDGAKEGDSLTIDLGASQVLGGLALIPAEYRQVPRGLRVELAGEDGRFATVRQGKGYWGPFYLSGPHPVLKARDIRVESYFPPQQARYLRLTHLGKSNHPWSVQEVLLFGPGQETQASWEDSARQVLKLLKQNRVQEVYGDAWITAKVVRHFQGRIKTVTGNAAINNFGTTIPPLSEPVVIKSKAGNALIVNQRAGDYVAQQLASYGMAYERHQAGRLVVFLLKGQDMGAVVAGEQSRAGESCLLWRVKGDRAADLGWLEVDNPRYDQKPTPSFTAQVQGQDGAWTQAGLVKAGPIAFSGQVLLAYTGEKNLYRFAPPLRARAIRLCPLQTDAASALAELSMRPRRP